MVLDSLLASRALIIEEGAAASRKAEGERRLILNLEEAEIARVLGEINDRWKSAVGG